MPPAVVVYDVPYRASWGWGVVVYLTTKGASAGALLLSLFLGWLGPAEETLFLKVGPGLSLLFLAATLVALVLDLRQPQRFLYILLHPNSRSWLSWGAYLLLGYGGLVLLWLALGGPEWLGFALVPSALLVAVYTSFLFFQAKGREMWQGWSVPLEILAQALILGAGALLLAGVLLGVGREPLMLLRWALFFSLLFHLVSLAPRVLPQRGGVGFGRPTVAAALGVGGLLPLLMLALAGANPPALGMASLLSLAGVVAWEYRWVYAAQGTAPG